MKTTAEGQAPIVSLVHCTDSARLKGRVVRIDELDRLIAMVSLERWNPKIQLDSPDQIVVTNIGERGDRKMEKAIRIPVPNFAIRMRNMWLAGMTSDGDQNLSVKPCLICDNVGDDVFQCCLCLCSMHRSCAEGSSTSICNADWVCSLPIAHIPAFPKAFMTSLCHLCISRTSN